MAFPAGMAVTIPRMRSVWAGSERRAIEASLMIVNGTSGVAAFPAVVRMASRGVTITATSMTRPMGSTTGKAMPVARTCLPFKRASSSAGYRGWTWSATIPSGVDNTKRASGLLASHGPSTADVASTIPSTATRANSASACLSWADETFRASGSPEVPRGVTWMGRMRRSGPLGSATPSTRMREPGVMGGNPSMGATATAWRAS